MGRVDSDPQFGQLDEDDTASSDSQEHDDASNQARARARARVAAPQRTPELQKPPPSPALSNSAGSTSSVPDGSLRLVPIDHGYSLPHALHVSDKDNTQTFAWQSWPQVRGATDLGVIEYVRLIDVDSDIRLLRRLVYTAIDEPSLLTLRFCTFLLQLGLLPEGPAALLCPSTLAQIGLDMSCERRPLSLQELGSAMMPSEVLTERSPLQVAIFVALHNATEIVQDWHRRVASLTGHASGPGPAVIKSIDDAAAALVSKDHSLGRMSHDGLLATLDACQDYDDACEGRLGGPCMTGSAITHTTSVGPGILDSMNSSSNHGRSSFVHRRHAGSPSVIAEGLLNREIVRAIEVIVLQPLRSA